MNPQSTPNLPFFAYGTLLPGQPNYALWQTAVISQRPATFANGRLYDLGAYPILMEGGDGIVKGMVIEIEPAAYETILARLDYLEGYDPAALDSCPYWRLVRPVMLADGGVVETWVYLGRPVGAVGLPAIESGDWISHAAAKQVEVQSWWRNIVTVGNL